MKANTIYTIGYSGFVIDEFIAILKARAITILVDVRSTPYSQYFSDYNKGFLEQRLKDEKVHYRNLANEFGARQDNKRFYSEAGYLDFELFTKSESFLSGMARVKNVMKQGYQFVLMCAEKDPIDCHRSIMVSRAFHDEGYNVIHILPNNENMSQVDIENRLLDMYFPDRKQISLFEDYGCTEDYIQEAYRKQNAVIGYSLKEENS